MRKVIVILIIAVVSLFVFLPVNVYGFRNKFIEHQFEWRVVKTEHADIYFPKELTWLSGEFAKITEDVYQTYSTKIFANFSWPVEDVQGNTTTKTNLVESWGPEKINLCFYPVHSRFGRSQRILVEVILPPGVQGFMERAGLRGAIPYPGDLEEFKGTVSHEMVHIFHFVFLKELAKQQGRRKSIAGAMPLYFTEGFAELISRKYFVGVHTARGAEVQNYLRQRVINGDIPYLSAYTGGFDVYAFGFCFLNYLDTNFGGTAKLIELMFNDFDYTKTYGVDLNQLQTWWREWLQLRFFVDIYHTDNTSVEKVDLPDLSVGSRYDQGKIIRYTRDKIYGLRIEVINVEPKTEGSSLAYSSTKIFHLFEDQSGYIRYWQNTVDQQNDLAAVVISRLGKDELRIYDTSQPKKTMLMKEFTLRNDNIITISSVNFVNDEEILFEGTSQSGISDIYLYSFRSKELIKHTDDHYCNRYPTMGKDGAIYFISNYRVQGKQGIYCLQDNQIKEIYLSNEGECIQQLRISPQDSKLAFTSIDFDNSRQIKVVDLTTDQLYTVYDNITQGVSELIDWENEQTLFCSINHQVKRLVVDLTTVAKNDVVDIDILAITTTTCWTIESAVETETPVFKYLYPVVLRKQRVFEDHLVVAVAGCSTVTGEQAITVDAQGTIDQYGFLGIIGFSKFDFRSRLEKKYTLSLNGQIKSAMKDGKIVSFKDTRLDVMVSLFYPLDFENGFELDVGTGYLKRDYDFRRHKKILIVNTADQNQPTVNILKGLIVSNRFA
ncbi:MAG: hypothetical protein KAS12_03695, partial [Candidatus Aenigmarchaeota archaeon]|nr:hypothetical protein [Candidatus Aenigmarchaeota archaeon]